MRQRQLKRWRIGNTLQSQSLWSRVSGSMCGSMVPHMTLVRRKPRRLQTDTQAERLAMELQATIELKAI